VKGRGWHKSLQGVDLSGANLDGVDLRGANLEGANLGSASLNKADLRQANLKGAIMYYAQLKGAKLGEVVSILEFDDVVPSISSNVSEQASNLENAKLVFANLEDADLAGVNLAGADLTFANLKNTSLIEANMQGADLSQVRLDKIRRLRWAIMPDGKRYSGMYELPNDLEDVGTIPANLNEHEFLAEFYGVTPEEYVRGKQEAYLRGYRPASHSDPLPDQNIDLPLELEEILQVISEPDPKPLLFTKRFPRKSSILAHCVRK
jgi:hypothetical protein